MTTTSSTQRFTATSTTIEGVAVVRRMPRRDERGEFVRLHCVDEFAELGLLGDGAVVQTNLSRSRTAGIVRGLHLLRPPAQEHKLLTCITGAVWDVVVDLRPDSSTWMRWEAVELSSDDDLAVVVPPGVAHGFQVLVPDTAVLHLYSDRYRSELDAGVHPLDPALGISWPISPVQLSERDLGLPTVERFMAEHAARPDYDE